MWTDPEAYELFHLAASRASIYESFSQVNAWAAKRICISESQKVCLSRVVCPEFSNYLHFSDNLSTARVPGSYFSMMLSSSMVHPWTRGYGNGPVTPQLAQMSTWELEERGLLITIKTTLSNYTGSHLSEPRVTRKPPSSYVHEYSCNGKRIQR